MFRERFEEMSFADLRKEVAKYGISNIPKSRGGCIDALLTHLERNGPLEEAQATFLKDAHGEHDPPRSSATGTTPKTFSDKNSVPDCSGKDTSSEYLPQLCSLLVQQISKQAEQMGQLQQMFASLMSNSLESRRQSLGDAQPVSRIQPANKISTLPPGHAVKFLSTQIP